MRIGGWAVVCVVVIVLVVGAISTAFGHDSWINKGGFKNSNNEWCCGAEDCKAYAKAASNGVGCCWNMRPERAIKYFKTASRRSPEPYTADQVLHGRGISHGRMPQCVEHKHRRRVRTSTNSHMRYK